MEHLRRLIDHLAWADERAIGALRAAGVPPVDALQIMAHVLGAEHVWLARLAGRGAELAVWPALTVDECAALAAGTVRELRRLVEELDEAALRVEVPYRNSAGQSFRSTREDILLHVAMHGAYHRGQVALLLRRAGHEPAATDYIAFTRGAPAAVWRLV